MPKRLTKPRSGLVAALDIGTSKVCCLIARLDRPTGEGAFTSTAQPRVVGCGHQVAGGMKNGAIVDMEAAEAAVRKAVHAAEQMAGETIRSVTVNLGTGKPVSETLGFDVDIGGQQIDDADLRRIFQKAIANRPRANGHANGHGATNGNGHANGASANGTNGNGANGNGPGKSGITVSGAPAGPEREVIHSVPVAYAIDGQRGIDDPRGMFGQRLSVDMHLISASASAVRTLRSVVERCHLEIDDLVLSPYASGLSTLVEDETDLGVTVIDMGGGTTSLAVFYDGQIVFADTLPVGGNHVTSDVARGLSTPLAHAERLKTFHGCATVNENDEHDFIDVPQIGEEETGATAQIPRSLLNGIIQPRIEETFELVRARLTDSGFAAMSGRRVVLVGGASQLQGAREFAARILDKQVRMGRPLRIRGLADAMAGPAFATAAGLIAHAIENPSSLTMPPPAVEGEPGGLTGRLGQWFRDHF